MMDPYTLDEKNTETLRVVKRVGETGRSLAPHAFCAPKWVFVTAIPNVCYQLISLLATN